MSPFNEIILNPKPKSECKGSIYKANVYNGVTTKGFGFFVRMERMAKMSCPGCKDCTCDELGDICNEYPIIDIEKAEHGKFYTLEVCNIGYEWESGIVDEWDWKLVEVKEEKDEHSSR